MSEIVSHSNTAIEQPVQGVAYTYNKKSYLTVKEALLAEVVERATGIFKNCQEPLYNRSQAAACIAERWDEFIELVDHYKEAIASHPEAPITPVGQAMAYDPKLGWINVKI